MPVVLMILGFMWWWPLGLIILGFLIARRKYGWRRQMYVGSGPMSEWSCQTNGWDDRWDRKIGRMQEKIERVRDKMESFRSRAGGGFGSPTSGNRAFDDYRAETLKRLEDEQREFKEYLERLRLAKDRAEFDQFMADRRQRPFEQKPAEEPPHA